MSQVHTSFFQLFKKGLGYRKFSYFRRNFNYTSFPALLQLHVCPTHVESVRHISENRDLKRRINSKFHNRVISNEEIEEDRKLSESMLKLPEEDNFGLLEKEQGTKQRKIKFTNYDKKFGEEKSFNRRNKQLKSTDDEELFNDGQYQSQSYRNNLSESQDNDRVLRRKEKKRWRNIFGTLCAEDDGDIIKSKDNSEEDIKPHIRLSKKGRRNEPDWYGEKIGEFGKQGKVREAIRVYDVWMLQNDRVMPNNYVISHLLSVLANAGYTKKAFQVFNQAKKMGIEPNDYIYSTLFNACANSPWPEDGLRRAKLLLEDLSVKNISLNSVTYNTIVKAFAVCGDARNAFLIADKHTSVEKLDSDAFSHVLMAAIADKKAGFWHAVQIWRWLLIKRTKPNIEMYNLMLRVIKECEVGDPVLAQQLLLPINPAATMKLFKKETATREDDSRRKPIGVNKVGEIYLSQSDSKSLPASSSLDSPSIASSSTDVISVTASSTNRQQEIGSINLDSSNSNTDRSILVKEDVSIENSCLPNILNPNEDFSHVVSISNVSTPQDRFAMVGGMTGFLSDMKRNGVQCNVKTFDQMLSLISPDCENQLLEIMEIEGVKPDIDLLTNLAYKRCCRFDYAGSKDVVKLIASHKLIPSMRTYSVLAMSCGTLHDGLQLLKNIKVAGVEPDIKVMGALVRSSGINFKYKKILLEEMEEAGLMPDNKILKTIEFQLKKAREVILKMEKEKEMNSTKYKKLDFQYEDFKVFYQSWLSRMTLDVPDHPWTPFIEKRTMEAK